MRLYVVHCASGRLWLVRASSESDAVARWDGEDPALSARRPERGEAAYLREMGQADV